MSVGRRFSARFQDDASRLAYLTWSAGQMFIYNECVREQRYFDSLSRLIAETRRRKQPIRPECRIERPEPDQKYSRFVDKKAMPWLDEVPSDILGIGAYRFYQACQRAKRGLTRRAKVHPIKDSDRKLLLTRRYFTIEPTSRDDRFKLRFGSARKPGGVIIFHAHRDFRMPAMVSVTLTARSLTVSFSFEEPAEEGKFPETEAEIAARLLQYSKAELEAHSVGLDRGVVRPVQSSHQDEPYGFTEAQLERMKRQARRRKRYQRMAARREKGSRNLAKARHRIARTYDYQRNVIEDFAHQTSHRLVSLEEIWVYVLEALKIQNMTKRPKAKYDEAGKPLRNGASAKAGLNAAVLRSGWGKTGRYLRYKAIKAGKLVLEVDPKNTSRCCPLCGTVDAKNRPSQAVFRCVRCGFEGNADVVATRNIRDRGIEMLIAGKFEPKKMKKLLRTKKAKPSDAARLGPGRADAMPAEPVRRAGCHPVPIYLAGKQEASSFTAR